MKWNNDPQKQKHNSTAKLFRVSVLEKGNLWQFPTFISSKHRSSKKKVPGKNATSYMFRPRILTKKVWVPTKRNPHFFGPNIAKKSVGSKKKELILFFSGRTLWQNKHGFQKSMSSKKRTLYMFRPNILPKKVWVPTKRKSHFFGPNIAPKKVRVPKKSMSSKKKGTYTFLGQLSAQKVWVAKQSMVPPVSFGSGCLAEWCSTQHLASSRLRVKPFRPLWTAKGCWPPDFWVKSFRTAGRQTRKLSAPRRWEVGWVVSKRLVMTWSQSIVLSWPWENWGGWSRGRALKTSGASQLKSAAMNTVCAWTAWCSCHCK